MDLKEIKQIIDLMKRSDLTEFSVEEENLKLKIRRQGTTPKVVTSVPVASAAIPAAGAPSSEQEEAGVTYIKSPMVGTFYSASSPDTPAFVDIKQQVKEGSIVCIIEAMKIMNEIQSETSGTVLEILVENGQPVEYGQRLFKLKSA